MKTRHPSALLRRLLLFFCGFCFSLLLTLGQAFFNPATANSPAIQLYESGQFAEAAEIWEQAVQSLDAQGDTLTQASLLSNLALAYHQLGDTARSDDAIAQSLSLLNALKLERHRSQHESLAANLAQIYNTQGNLYLLKSQPTQALEAFQTATTYYTEADDLTGILRSQLNQAQALQALGFYRRALITLTDLTPPLVEQPDTPMKIAGLQMLGDLQRTTGNLPAAQMALNEGLRAAEALNNSAVSALQLSLGHTAEANGDVERAFNHYQTAIDTTQTMTANFGANSIVALRAQLSQLSLLTATDDTALAHRLADNIQAALETLPVDRVALNIRLDLARQQLDVASRSSQMTQALGNSLAIALQQAKNLSDPRAESYALGYLGELYRQQNQPSEAKSALQSALALATDLPAPDLAYQWQWQLGQLERAQGNTARAIIQYDNAVENLQALRGNLIAIAPDLRFNFTEKVEPVYRELVDLLLSDAAAAVASEASAHAQPSLIKARHTIESLQLAEVENFFQEPCVALSQQIDQIIENTVSPTAVIYPIILRDRLEIVLKLPQQPLQQFTTAIAQSELETLLTQFQRDLRLPFTINAVQSESAQLYDWLIRPMEPALANSQIDTLVFVLDGFLRSIPMAALYDGQHYLVENYAIAMAPGLQLVDPQPLSRQNLAILVAGLSEPRHGFSALPGVQDEVDQVQQNIKSQVLFNESFTETNLAAAINATPYPLVHLATHGQFSSDPNDTFVLAWDKPIQVNALNRLLRQSEQSSQGSIELLILSACETAAGDKRAALGLAGVAVQAGARSTLASLWNLDDETGALFSDYFYQALQSPDSSKAEAVRAAQLKLLAGGDASRTAYQHPRYWAPYVLLGNWL